MKRYSFLIIIAFFTLFSCEPEEGNVLTVNRTPHSLDLINTHGGHLYIQALKDTITKIKANTANIRGELIKVANLTTDTLWYGHVWSENDQAPDIRYHASVMSLGQPQPRTFETRISGLKAETQYYVRSFVITDRDTAYNRQTTVFTTIRPENEWDRMANFLGVKRQGAIAFTIDNKAYVGGGENAYGLWNDFYVYDKESDMWNQTVNIPGRPRTQAVAFAISGRGYVGTGWNGEKRMSDFYAFEPGSNFWVQIDDFIGGQRAHAIGFALNGKGYVGFGEYGAQKKDLFEYDPQRQINPNIPTWKKMRDLPANGRQDAIAFTILNKAYIGLGNDDTLCYNDFWVFDPELGGEYGSWSRREDFPAEPRTKAFGMSIDDEGFVGGGEIWVNDTIALKNDFWMYDPYDNRWVPKADYGGGVISDGVAFSLGKNYGYAGIGVTIEDLEYTYSTFFWRYSPYDRNTDIINQ